MGPEWHSAALTAGFLSVRCGVIGIGTGGISSSGAPLDLGLPVTTSSLPWHNILTLSGLMILLIIIGIYASTSEGRKIWGRSDDDYA